MCGTTNKNANPMFCYQCEQTPAAGCTKFGMWKEPDIASTGYNDIWT